jgi:hypothetical protein
MLLCRHEDPDSCLLERELACIFVQTWKHLKVTECVHSNWMVAVLADGGGLIADRCCKAIG